MGKIPVMEVFGPCIQGEGMMAGRKTVFVRTANCDYSCSWCDSKFTWDGTEKDSIVLMEAQDLVNEVIKVSGSKDGILNFSHVTISGGNPALIGRPMEEFIKYLHSGGISVGLETQGSIWRDWFYQVNDLTISPKPPSSLMKTSLIVLDGIIENLINNQANCPDDNTHQFSLKVVVFCEEDYEFAVEMHERYPDVPFYLSVGNIDAEEQGDISGRLLKDLDNLWNRVISDPRMNDVITLPQLHTLVYGNKRKV